MSENRFRPHPFAVAIEWVAKITTVALEMFLPAVAGNYLDQRLGTRYWAVVGVVVGFVVGMWHLLQMTRVRPRGGASSGKRGNMASGEGEEKSGGSAGV